MFLYNFMKSVYDLKEKFVMFYFSFSKNLKNIMFFIQTNMFRLQLERNRKQYNSSAIIFSITAAEKYGALGYYICVVRILGNSLIQKSLHLGHFQNTLLFCNEKSASFNHSSTSIVSESFRFSVPMPLLELQHIAL